MNYATAVDSSAMEILDVPIVKISLLKSGARYRYI